MAQKQLDIAVILSGKVDSTFSKLEQAITNVGNAAMGVSGPLIQAGKEGVEVYKTYEQNMKDAEAALSSTYRNSGELEGIMGNLGEAAQDWAASTKFSTSDVSEAISEAAHAGMSYEEIMSTIPQAMLLAQAGNMDLSTSLDYVIKSTNALGLDLDDLGTFIDEWAMGANSSATSIDEFGEAMLRMGSTMQFAGSTEDMFTMLAVLANMGTTGAEAGTLLRNAMLRILAPTDKASEMLEGLGDVTDDEMQMLDADGEALAAASEQLTELGFSAYDTNGELKPMTQIFRDLDKATRKLTEKDRNELLSTIFGTRSITGAMNLMKAAANDYDGLMEQIENSGGYAEQVSGIQMDSLAGSTSIFESKIEELKRHVGEVLAPQVEWGQTFIGAFVDKLNSLDDEKFNTLTGALEGIAATGPALLLVGGAVTLISKLATPLGLVTVGALALGGALGVLATHKDDVKFEDNFGTMALDINSLKASVDGLTTDDEDAFADLQEYVTQLDTLATQYQEAGTKLSSEITLGTLTGKTLTSEEQQSITKYGQQIGQTLREGIESAKNLSLSTLNAAYTDEELQNPETYKEYSHLYDLLTDWYGDLEGQATQVGNDLNEAILTAFENDGRIDQVEAAKIEQYQEAMNNIQAQIMAMENAEEYSRMLERSQSVSWDTMEEYLTYLGENTQTRVDNMNEYYYRLMGQTRAKLDADRREAGLSPLTDEDWHGTEEYKSIEGQRTQSESEITGQTSWFANQAFDTLFSQSGYGQAWNAIKGIMSNVQYDESGKLLPGSIQASDIGKYIGSAEELKGVVDLANLLQDRSQMESVFGLSKDEFGSLMSVWENTPGAEGMAAAINNIGALTSLFPQVFGWGGWFGDYGEDMGTYQNAYERMGSPTNTAQPTQTSTAPQVDLSVLEGETIPVTAEVEDVETPEDTTITGTMDVTQVNTPEGGTTELGAAVVNTAEAGSAAHSEMQSSMDAAGELTAQADVPNATQAGSEAHSEVQSGITAAGPVNVTARVSNAWSLPGDIQSAIGSRTYSIQVRANVTGMPGGTRGGYAQGGRADTISFFGEAGPEWAIPEEHTQNTANLIAQAIEASGFSWDELYSAFAESPLIPPEGGTPSAPSSEGGRGVFPGAQNAGGLPTFATGGRTDTPGIFGEAGPEWAIPEEHTQNTASLIDSARQASGFSWAELANDSLTPIPEDSGALYPLSQSTQNLSDNRTFVYQPTIIANDATDVEEKLKEDKDHLEKWWQEKQLTEKLGAYA